MMDNDSFWIFIYVVMSWVPWVVLIPTDFCQKPLPLRSTGNGLVQGFIELNNC